MQVGAALLLDIHLFTIHPQVIAIGLDLRGIGNITTDVTSKGVTISFVETSSALSSALLLS